MKLCVQDARLHKTYGYKKAYEAIRAAGFEAIDWNIDTELRSKMIRSATYEGNTIFEKSVDEMMAYYQEELDAIRDAGLTISQAHAPFPCYDFECVREDTFDFMIEVYKKIIILLDRVGCKNMIVHGITLDKKDRINTPETIRALNKKLYTSLIPTLQQTNVTVCLENLFKNSYPTTPGHCSNPYEAVQEIDELNALAGKECFGLCLDTGHLNLVGLEPRTYMPILGKRIKALHIHDNDGLLDQHKAPYTGKFKWADFYTILKDIGYEGDLSFETFMQTDPTVIEEPLLLPWLTLIAQIGDFFRKKILE